MLFVGLGDGRRPSRIDAGHLPAADHLDQIARPKRGFRDLDVAQGRPGDALLVAAIIDGELLGIAKVVNLTSENPAHRASGTWRFPVSLASVACRADRAGPLLHLAGRLVGEGDGENPAWGNPVAESN